MIDKIKQAEILRLYEVEKLKKGEIARNLGVHHSVVRRVINQKSGEKATVVRRRMVDPYLSTIETTLLDYPGIKAQRLWTMMKARGYPGQVSQFRAIVASLRGNRRHIAYLRLETVAGEQGQVDWADFGYLEVGSARRKLSAFVMVLSHSRAIFVRFYLSQRLDAFLDGHARAFDFFCGVPRHCLYDNLKSVVLDRVGQTIRFNEQFIDFASAFRFEPRPVGVRKGNEKGKVERAIQYLRKNFFEARTISSLNELNQEVHQWCLTEALQRPWAQNQAKTVELVFCEEKSSLLPLPTSPYPLEERCTVSVPKTPYFRFDLNDYSVPPEYVQKRITVLTSIDTVRAIDGTKEIARHVRSYDRKHTTTDPTHIEQLKQERRNAAVSSGTHTLSRAVPFAKEFITAATQSGVPPKKTIAHLQELLSNYGTDELQAALELALQKNIHESAALFDILEKRRCEKGRQPRLPLPKAVPNYITTPVKGTPLSDYTFSPEDLTDEK